MSYDISDLRVLYVPELKKIAKDMGIVGVSQSKKEDIINKIIYYQKKPCENSKERIKNKCEYPNDISTLTKKELDKRAAILGILNAKAMNKETLVKMLTEKLGCGKDEHVNKDTMDCDSNQSGSESENESVDESGSESGSESEKRECR
jgi:hypothetical protein